MRIKVQREKSLEDLENETSRMYKLKRKRRLISEMKGCQFCGRTWQSKHNGSGKKTWKRYRKTQYR